MRTDPAADITAATTAWLRVPTVFSDTYDKRVRWPLRHVSSLTNNPLVILGRNQVDLGGMTNP